MASWTIARHILLGILLPVIVCSFSPNVQYKRKIQSAKMDDGFGSSMDAYNGTLAVGAPSDNDEVGSVRVFSDEARAATIIRGPSSGGSFGAGVSMNKDYMAVVGGAGEELPSCVYIYSSEHPHPLKARLPYGADEEVVDVAIGNDNTVVVALVSTVHVYRYDGKATWHAETQWTFGIEDLPTVAISGHFVAIGLPNKAPGRSRVLLYGRVKGAWSNFQKLQPPKEQQFGENTVITDDFLAVSSKMHTFIYRLDKSKHLWRPDGNSLAGISGHMAIRQNLLAVTSNDKRTSNVVSNLYIRGVDKHGKVSWYYAASLTGEPLKADQKNWRVRIDGKLVYTSRIDESGEDFAVLYVHDLSHKDDEQI